MQKQKRVAWECAGLLDALFQALPSVALPESALPELLGWPRENVEQALHELERKGRLLRKDGRIRLLPWPESFRAAARKTVAQMDMDEAEHGLFHYFLLGGTAPESCLAALESLSELFNLLARQGSRPACDVIFPLFLHAMKNVSSPGAALAPRYIELCRRAFPMALCVSVPCDALPVVLLKGRGLALCHGLHLLALELDMLIGGTNVLNHSRHNHARFHALMARAYNLLRSQGEQALLEQNAHVVGIYFFMEGKFQRAVDEWARVSSHPFWPAICTAAHRALLSALAAAFLGEGERAETLLRQALRGLPQPGYPGLVGLFRVALAMVMLDHGKDELALERLDLAMSGVDSQDDLPGWINVSQGLAVYHYNQQRLYAAYATLCNGTDLAMRVGYARPLYLFPAMLELLERLHLAKLPPVPGYSANAELARCLQGPNILLRGVALRLQGNRLDAMGREDQALEHYERSLALFRQIRAYDEAAKTRFALARFHLNHNDRARAAVFAAEAGLRLNSQLWPIEMSELLPSAPPENTETAHPTTEMELLGAFLDPLQNREWKNPEIFRENLIRTSCQALGLHSGYLFRWKKGLPPELVLGLHLHGNADIPPPLDLVDIALSGSPALVTHPLSPGQSRERHTLCLPLACSGDAWALCHEGELPAWTLEMLSEALLARIGKALAWEMEQNLRGFPLPAKAISGDVAAAALSLPMAAPSAESPGNAELLFCCPIMAEFMHRADLAAVSEATVLITGESGTGKELVARRIHAVSGREGAFVPVNLAGIPDDLFENEMLGHEKGAFTGAQSQKPGLLELAHNGTLFLDELTETSPRVQAKLLRLLQERVFYRLGGTRPIHSQFRLVTATNQNLAQAVSNGTFREDLFYRISVAPLHVPPLRERRADILLIALHYLRFFISRYGSGLPVELPHALAESLLAWHWPGNVRELKNRMERFVIMHGEDSPPASASLPLPHSTALAQALATLPRISLSALSEAYMRLVLAETNQRVDGAQGAAAILGVSRASLYQKIKSWRDSC